MRDSKTARTGAKVQLRLLQSTAWVALALASLAANAGPGSVCMDGVSPVSQCSDGTIRTYYANSPLLRKFVDTLPGLTAANSNAFANSAKTGSGEYIPIATPDTQTYPGSNYYVIAAVEHTQWMHSDLQKATQQRSYVQIYPQGQLTQPSGSFALRYPDGSKIFWKDANGKNTAEQVYAFDKPHYLGPIIITESGTPVRVKMVNLLPTGSATLANGHVLARNGDIFLPVDESLAGAGTAPDGTAKYTQNRLAFHLHGGDSPWISDGTPHQWMTPAGDATPFKNGDRMVNVPDMPYPGDGAQTLFWPNNQSARLIWYHDHAVGLTRQNVYAGAAAGYVIMDPAELALINGGTVKGQTIAKAIPGTVMEQLVLVLQDKSFVPDDIARQDAKWNTSAWGKPGDMWYPHVYEPNQIWAADGSFTSNPAGRWDYATDTLGAYQPPAQQLLRNDPDFGNVAFPDGSYADGTPGKGPSAVPESYMDTPLVNGVAYPVLHVQPKAYRARFLNGSNDRYWNLSLWVADGNVRSADGRSNTEIRVITDPSRVVDYTLADGSKVHIPATRPGGIPDPRMAGPNIIQFGNETGLLPKPVVHTPKPVTGAMDPDSGTFELARGEDFYLANAERADTVIDFSQYAGKTLILYNDSSAPVPAGDTRYDYYTDGPDLSTIGGAPSTRPGFGPNTRTVMQIVVAPLPSGTTQPPAPYDPKGNGGPLASELPKAYAASVEPTIAPELTATGLPEVDLARNQITLADGTHTLLVKTIEGFTDPNFGRLIAQIGAELPGITAPGAVSATPLSYVDKPTEILAEGETQYWLIKNNDGDNHPMHFHLFNVQVIARINQATKEVFAPQAEEAAWKETVKNWPGEDLIVAMKPKTPQLPFGIPNSVRLMDPTLPLNALTSTAAVRPGADPQFAFLQMDLNTGAPQTVTNTVQNFGWEYVWHCHILGHEENDLMRPIVFVPNIHAPLAATDVAVDATGKVSWTDPTPAGGVDENGVATKGNPGNEIGFSVQRVALKSGQPVARDAQGAPVFSALAVATGSPVIDARVNTLANATSLQDKPSANTDYLYQVMTVNEAGQTPATHTAMLSQAPAAPTALSASQSTAQAASNTILVNLRWSDNASNETGYRIERDGVPIGTTPADASSFVDTLTAPYSAVAYRYTVAAQKTGFPDSAVASTSFQPAPMLVQPSNLSGTYNATARTMALSWNDLSVSETGYVVRRATGTVAPGSGTVTWSAFTARPTASSVLAANTTAAVDTGLAANTLYQYEVSAMNGASAGPAATFVAATASTLSAATKLEAYGPATRSSLGLQWENSVTNFTTGYEVQACAGSAASCSVASAVWLPVSGSMTVGASTTKFVASGLSGKTSYAMRVRAVSKAVTGMPLTSAWTAALEQQTL